jgi:rubrerythrin
MEFNPLKEKGTPLEKQIKNWSTLLDKPYNVYAVHPYTRTRIINMNGQTMETSFFSHQFARHTSDLQLKRELAMIRRVEQQQQKRINWLIPKNESNLETTLGYEQVAVDLTAYLAQHEPDQYVKQVLDFALVEDFDHLYRYANLYDMLENKDPKNIIGDFTEITVGRPTALEHRHPIDEVRKPSDVNNSDVRTLLNIQIILAAEQQTWNFYNNIGPKIQNDLGRGLYLEIAQIEEEHVTHYESLIDPNMSWFMRNILHHYTECYLYYSYYLYEVDTYIKNIWEENIYTEVEHIHNACSLMKRYEKKDPPEIIGKFPEPFVFKSNIDYVRKVIKDQTQLNARETKFFIFI